MDTVLDQIDRRIIGVLQVDGRASFKLVAEVLNLPERTVSRRGQDLLNSGVVQVTGLSENDRVRKKGTVVLSIECAPGTNRIVARALASLSESIFVYLTSGANLCIAEVFYDRNRPTDLILNQIPGIPGVVKIKTFECLKYYRTAAEWNPGLLTNSERKKLLDQRAVVNKEPTELNREDKTILDTLAKNGRATFDQLARSCGLSEATARRRTTNLIESGALSIHAVVEPSDIGFPIESWIWIQTAPDNVMEITQALLKDHRVRYLTAISGEFQLLAQVALASKGELNDFLFEKQAWSQKIQRIENVITIEAFKRSGLLVREGKQLVGSIQ